METIPIKIGFVPRLLRVVPAAVALLLATGCATAVSPASDRSGRLHIVAVENFWGSIAGQLGGSRATVTSIINRPGTDPHEYEPTPADARAFANAQLVVVNGVGYDPWADKLLAANPVGRRIVLKVGDVVGASRGDNPHRWYAPADVEQVISALTADLQSLEPATAPYFTAQRQRLESQGLADYHRLIGDIKAKYAGTPVGASESIFALLAPSLGLDLATPPGFLKAISEGTEPSAADKAEIDRQIRTHAIKVYVYNSQNTTPDVLAQIAAARREGIPVTTITETLIPAGASFQQWQSRQLTELAAALAKANGQ
jgi:zinc/manganese transport system substrate-binding protein